MGSSTWDTTPAPAIDNSWKTDGDAGATDGGWQADGDTGAQDNGFTFSDANISKHANGDIQDGGAGDSGCRICQSDSHFARDCPDKPANSGECYNCGEVGHNKADCPNERVEREFTGECHVCGESGHRRADCPSKPPTTCKLCKAEGHSAADCDVNRIESMIKDMDLPELDQTQAWDAIEKADNERDLDSMREAVLCYARAYPKVTLEELEDVFRQSGMNTHLIAKEQEISDMHTIVNLQGKQDQKYVVSFQWSDKPKRKAFADGWPKTAEENVTRLAEAGFVMDGLKTKCSNCGEIGHKSKQCEQEKNEAAKIVITCANCSEEGHRARDCTQPRKSANKGCRNCGSEEHIAKECPEPRSAEGVECKNCGEMGHFSRDCPSREPETCRNCLQEGHRAKDCENERVVKCRNCDEIGHVSRECSKPTDWSRVECSNCHEKGHSYKRCTKPPPEEDAGSDGGFGEGSGTASGGGDGGWGNEAAPVAASGGW